MHPENRQILVHRLREGSEYLKRGVLIAPLKDVVDRVAIQPGFARQAALAHRSGWLHRLAERLPDPIHVDGARRHVTHSLSADLHISKCTKPPSATGSRDCTVSRRGGNRPPAIDHANP